MKPEYVKAIVGIGLLAAQNPGLHPDKLSEAIAALVKDSGKGA